MSSDPPPSGSVRAEVPADLADLLRRAFDDAPIGKDLALLPEGRLIRVNRALCELLGYPEEELVRLTWKELTHPEDLAADLALWERLLAGELPSYHLEKRYLRRDGTVIWALVHASVVRDADGEPRYALGQVQDITDRKRAELALGASEERYRTLFDGIPVGVYRTTPGGEVLEANRALVEMLGYPFREAFLAVNARDVYADPELRHRWTEAMDRDRVVRDFELPLRRWDGTVIWVRDTGRAVTDQEGEVAYYEGTLEDVTARRRAERLLAGQTDILEGIARRRPLGETLEALVGLIEAQAPGACWSVPIETRDGTVLGTFAVYYDRPEEPPPEHRELVEVAKHLAAVAIEADRADRALREALRHLEEHVASKDRFLAAVSHEVRTPLTAVVGFAQELLEGSGRFGEDELAELISVIADQAAEVAAIVEDLLVAARADLGELAVEPARLDLGDQVRSVIAGWPALQRDRVELEGRALAWADPGRVRQVLRNLLTNALRYGGGRIVVRLTTSGDRVRAEVLDDGEGVPEEVAERIFEPYYRADRDGAFSPSGIGLGLYVARSLARLMDGDLTSERRDRWTCFSLTLPAPGRR